MSTLNTENFHWCRSETPLKLQNPRKHIVSEHLLESKDLLIKLKKEEEWAL